MEIREEKRKFCQGKKIGFFFPPLVGRNLHGIAIDCRYVNNNRWFGIKNTFIIQLTLNMSQQHMPSSVLFLAMFWCHQTSTSGDHIWKLREREREETSSHLCSCKRSLRWEFLLFANLPNRRRGTNRSCSNTKNFFFLVWYGSFWKRMPGGRRGGKKGCLLVVGKERREAFFLLSLSLPQPTHGT